MKNFNFIKARKPALIIAGAIILIGIVLNVIFGVTLDVEFKGGTIIQYSYTGELTAEKIENVIEDTIGKKVNVQLTSDISGETQLANVTLADNTALSTDTISKIDDAMVKAFPNNKVENAETNSVNPTMGKGFFIKCIFATLLGALLITVYIGFRFRKIGGVSASICALLCLFHDIIIAYFVYVIFGFTLDSNFIAVVLTLFGYSLNGTIVIYDRIRENRKIYGRDMDINEIVDMSVRQTFTRNLITSLATFVSLVCVCVVAWVGGLTNLISFVLPMAVGVVAGCYSSVFLSSPVWAWWREKRGDPAEIKKAKKAKRLEKKAARARAKKLKARKK
ncbi:MAG: protein translocase subunit SecF [Clostridia bacterium]|nr:protein translocase subunit SecF [Clostridia bacterium]